MDRFALCYIFFCLFCIGIIVILFCNLGPSIGRKNEVMAYQYLSISASVCILAQAFWIAGEHGIIEYNNTILYIINFFDNTFTAFSVYFWFIVITVKAYGYYPKTKRYAVFADIPIAVLVFMNIASYWTHWTFYISSAGSYTRGRFYFMQVLCSYIYYIFTLFIEIKGMRTGTVTERMLYQKLLLFLLVPILGGGLQIIIGSFPFTVATILISILFLYISILNQRINTDALTGLNNRLASREKAEDYINEAEKNPFFLYLMDINDFKQINDTYGHNEGDKALVTVSDALRLTVRNHRGFIGRYGGDEFIAMILSSGIGEADTFLSEINKNIGVLSDRRGLGYEITIAAGYSYCDRKYADRLKLTDEADEMLYKVKTAMKSSIDDKNRRNRYHSKEVSYAGTEDRAE